MPLKEATGKGAHFKQDVAQVSTMMFTERPNICLLLPLTEFSRKLLLKTSTLALLDCTGVS